MKTLSIITINRNNASGLEKTIQSVIGQTSTDFEYIIIDGASNDESVNIIKKYTDKIDFWVSEPDIGVYNAMNKGIRKATGKYCLFLNSADCLVSPETLSNVFKEIHGIQADIFYTDMMTSNNEIRKVPIDLTLKYLAVCSTPNHQNTLIKRSLFLEDGHYNEDRKIAADWEFFLLAAWKYKRIFCYISTIITVYDTNGISSDPSLKAFRNSEAKKITETVFQDLADTIIEHRTFYRTIFYDFHKEYGNPKLIIFLLRAYRKFIILYKRIISIFKRV